jgi:hypothetical protein
MRSTAVTEDSRLACWRRVREFAVPPSMIESATARRLIGDWAGACAAAHIDVDLNLRSVARTHGRDVAARLRTDLRHLAPDLLRWHMPRIAPDGLLRPGLTVSLARYAVERGRPIHLVARTPPACADAGQRIGLALWDGSPVRAARHQHPHPHPHRRFRLDLHPHLWDVRRSRELRARSGTDRVATDGSGGAYRVPPDCAVDRWPAEAEILLRADGRAGDAVAIRLGNRCRLVLRPGDAEPRIMSGRHRDSAVPALPMLPDAATWVLPDQRLLLAGLIDADRLHPLVASALVPHHSRSDPPPDGDIPPRFVDCRGARHRIGLVAGVLVLLDHDPDEIRREELLAQLTGTPLPCLQAIEEAHRRPKNLDDIRARLDHGDIVGALAAVEDLLGPEAVLRDGALRDALETTARRRIARGLFRSGLTNLGPLPAQDGHRHLRHRFYRTHPRHAMSTDRRPGSSGH